MLSEVSNASPCFAASFLSTVTFSHGGAFILFYNCLPKHTCQADCSFLHVFPQIHKPCFPGSLLWLLLHDPYRKFMWQERKRLHSKRAELLTAKGSNSEGLERPVAGFTRKPKWDVKWRREQRRRLPAPTAAGLTAERGCGCGHASGRLRASRCERPSPLSGPACPPLPWEFCFVPPSSSSGGWAWLRPHRGGTGLLTPSRCTPDSVVRDLLAPCNPKADQTCLSQPEALSTSLLLSRQGSKSILWKGQDNADELSFPCLSVHSLLYLLVIRLFVSSSLPLWKWLSLTNT